MMARHRRGRVVALTPRSLFQSPMALSESWSDLLRISFSLGDDRMTFDMDSLLGCVDGIAMVWVIVVVDMMNAVMKSMKDMTRSRLFNSEDNINIGSSV